MNNKFKKNKPEKILLIADENSKKTCANMFLIKKNQSLCTGC